MSISGISVSQEIIKRYEDKRMSKKEGGLILKIEDESIKIDHDVDDIFDNALQFLPADEPRYVLYDVAVKNRANLEDLRTVFLFWMPMESPVRKRMMYSSTKSVITSNFRGIATSIQEEEMERLSSDFLQMKINKTQGINNPVY
jgi:cofilin